MGTISNKNGTKRGTTLKFPTPFSIQKATYTLWNTSNLKRPVNKTNLSCSSIFSFTFFRYSADERGQGTVRFQRLLQVFLGRVPLKGTLSFFPLVLTGVSTSRSLKMLWKDNKNKNKNCSLPLWFEPWTYKTSIKRATNLINCFSLFQQYILLALIVL